MLVGPLRTRAQVIRAAVRGLAHPCTASKLADFDDDKGLPRDDANVWLLFGSAPADTVVPKPKETKKRAGEDEDKKEVKVATPRTWCLAQAKEQDKDAVDGLTLAIDLFSFLQVRIFPGVFFFTSLERESTTRSSCTSSRTSSRRGPRRCASCSPRPRARAATSPTSRATR